jgi:hypothetical protein
MPALIFRNAHNERTVGYDWALPQPLIHLVSRGVIRNRWLSSLSVITHDEVHAPSFGTQW